MLIRNATLQSYYTAGNTVSSFYIQQHLYCAPTFADWISACLWILLYIWFLCFEPCHWSACRENKSTTLHCAFYPWLILADLSYHMLQKALIKGITQSYRFRSTHWIRCRDSVQPCAPALPSVILWLSLTIGLLLARLLKSSLALTTHQAFWSQCSCTPPWILQYYTLCTQYFRCLWLLILKSINVGCCWQLLNEPLLNRCVEFSCRNVSLHTHSTYMYSIAKYICEVKYGE